VRHDAARVKPRGEETQMIRRTATATVSVFVAWSVLDFVVHGIALGRSYAETPGMWRPMEEMKMGILHLVVLVSAAVFTSIYAFFIGRKSTGRGLAYGVLFGFGAGVSMGIGSWCVMPIPKIVAIGWFLGTLLEGAVGGLIAGSIIRE
jgi:hypothetical protein